MSETNGSAEGTEGKVETKAAAGLESEPEVGESGPPPGWEAAKGQAQAQGLVENKYPSADVTETPTVADPVGAQDSANTQALGIAPGQKETRRR